MPAPRRADAGSPPSSRSKAGRDRRADAGVGARRDPRRREPAARPPPTCSPSTAGTARCPRSGPFLAYAELATMFDTLSSLYEALTPVLGLGDIDELIAPARGDAAGATTTSARTSTSSATRWSPGSDPDDEHAALVAAAVGAKKPDLDAIGQLLADAPDYSGDTAILRRLAGLALPTDEQIRDAFKALRVAQRAHDDAAKTDAARATNVAALLRRALAVRDPDEADRRLPGLRHARRARRGAGRSRPTEQAAALDEQAEALTRGRRQALDGGRRRRVERPARRERARRPGARAARVRPRATTDVALADARRDEVIAAAAALRALAERATASSRAAARPGRSSPTHVAAWLEQAREVEAPRRHPQGAQGRREVGQGRRRRAARASASPRSPSARSRTGASCARARPSTCTRSRSRSPAGPAGRTSTSAPTATRRQRARRDVAGRAARALGQRLPAARGARRVAVPLRGDRRPGAGDGPGQGRRARARPAPRGPHAPDRRLHPRRPAAGGDPPPAAGRDDAARRPPRALGRRRAGLAQPGPALPRRRARLRASRTGCRPRSRRAWCRCSAAARSRPRRPTSSAAARPSAGTSLDEADEQIEEARTLRETLALVLFGEAGRQGEVGRRDPAPLRRGRRPGWSPSSTAARTAPCSTRRRSSACPRARASSSTS